MGRKFPSAPRGRGKTYTGELGSDHRGNGQLRFETQEKAREYGWAPSIQLKKPPEPTIKKLEKLEGRKLKLTSPTRTSTIIRRTPLNNPTTDTAPALPYSMIPPPPMGSKMVISIPVTTIPRTKMTVLSVLVVV